MGPGLTPFKERGERRRFRRVERGKENREVALQKARRPWWFHPCTRKLSIVSVGALKPSSVMLRCSVRMLPGGGGHEVVVTCHCRLRPAGQDYQTHIYGLKLQTKI